MSVKSQHKITHQQADGAVHLPFEKVFTAKVSNKDASHKVYFPIEAGQMIIGITVRCVTTLNGVTPALTVGDKTTAALWVATGDVIETAGNVFSTFPTIGAKYFSAVDRIVCTFNSDATAGEFELRVLYSGKEA